MQAVHVLWQAVGAIPIEAVGDQQDDRALTEHALGPKAVEAGDGLANASAAGPVGHRVGDHLESNLRVAGAQLAGDVGQPSAEEKDVDAVSIVGDGMEEVQQDLGVACHRAGDVA